MIDIELALRIALVALAAASLITVLAGIVSMQRSGERRAAEHDRRHAETMAALDAQRRAADQRDAHDRQRHAETMTALRELIDGQRSDRAALAELITRTAPTTETPG